jgi:RecA/RadA recombinase
VARAAKKEDKPVKKKSADVVDIKTARKKKEAPVEPVAFNPYAHLNAELNKTERKFDLTAMSFDKNEPRFSVGLLTLNVMLANGLLGGGWYTCSGGEQSCKSTLAMTILASIMGNSNYKGIAAYFDYEGSSQAEYIENMMRYMGVSSNIDSVFGIMDDETGDYIVEPRVRYYTPNIGENFYSYLADLERMLPDKIRKKKQWWYVYDNTKANQKALKGKYDAKLFSKHNKFYVPAEDGSIQAIILVDSYPAMQTTRSDEKDDGDKTLGAKARMHADGLARVKSKMRRKRIVVLGINQLRDNIGVMHGPPQSEPGGNALKFFSDVRFRNSSVSVPGGSGPFEEEKSVCGEGNDIYRYIKIRTFKNKLGGIPNQETYLRLIHEDANGVAKGFCRTWDTYQYLKLTGQVAGNVKKIKFPAGFEIMKRDAISGKEKLHKIEFKSPLVGLTLNWMEFKTLIEGDRPAIKKLCIKLGIKPVLVRTWYEKQCSDGHGFSYMKDWKRALAAKKRSADEADGEDEE